MAADRPVPKEFEGLLEPEEIHALQDAFLDETAEELDRVMHALATAEFTHFDEDILHQLFRAIHSLKGSASVFGYDELSRISHTVESSLAVFRGPPAGRIEAHVDDVLYLVGILLRMVRDGKADRMDCTAAEMKLASWIANEGGRHRITAAEEGSEITPASTPVRAEEIASSAIHVKPAAVLIVDSARTLHHILHRFLEPYSIPWFDCQSAAEVIERCAVEPPSSLFLGYVLPDMDTADLLSILFEASIAPPMIVVISSRGEEELRRACPYPFTFIRKDHTLFGTLLPLVQTLAAE